MADDEHVPSLVHLAPSIPAMSSSHSCTMTSRSPAMATCSHHSAAPATHLASDQLDCQCAMQCELQFACVPTRHSLAFQSLRTRAPCHGMVSQCKCAFAAEYVLL